MDGSEARAEEVRRAHKPRHQGTRAQLPAGDPYHRRRSNPRLRGDARGRDGGFAKSWRRETGGKQPASCLLEREDCTLAAWYRSVYAPRTGGAYDSHHRTAGIAGRIWRRGSRVAAHGAGAAAWAAGDWTPQQPFGRYRYAFYRRH